MSEKKETIKNWFAENGLTLVVGAFGAFCMYYGFTVGKAVGMVWSASALDFLDVGLVLDDKKLNGFQTLMEAEKRFAKLCKK